MLVQTSRLQGKLPSAVLWEFSYRVSCQLVKSSIVSALCNETLARPTPQLSALLPFLLLLSCSGSLFVFPTLIPPLLSPFASCSSASLRGTLRLGSVFLPPLVVLRCGLPHLFVWCLLRSPRIFSIHSDNTEARSMLLLSFLPTEIIL